TLFMYLMALVNVLMYKYTGQKDILLGSPIAGRPHRDLEDQIGFFVNMIVFRTKLDADISFAGLLKDTRKNASGAYEHEMYPFIQLAEDLNLSGGQANLFNVVVQLQNAKLQRVKNKSLEGVIVNNFRPNSYSSKFDITFNFEDVEEEGVITMDIEFKTDLFKESTIHKMKEDLFRLMQLASADASVTIRQLRSALAEQAGAALQLTAISADY
ncbi:MAG TPA: condensation domain-containing protein, partial [Chitinophagaceae bacterium]|nr:condensation domain-containing protein [Chitinophagaceae bacterium]